MSKFLLVSARPGRAQQAAEYRDFLVNTGLRSWELDHVVLDSRTATLGDFSGYDGVLLGGSPMNVTTERPTDEQLHIEQELLAPATSDVPAFYVCFGNSLLTKYHGGQVQQAYSEEAGPTWVELTATGRQDPLLAGLPARFTSLTGHTESVTTLAHDAELLASGPTCPVQMFRLPGNTWSCQFHADMDIEAMLIRMEFYRTNGYFNPLEFEVVANRVSQVNTRYSNQILQNFVRYCRRKATAETEQLLLSAEQGVA